MFEKDKRNPNLLYYTGLDKEGNALPSGHISIEKLVADQLTSMQEKFFLVTHNSSDRYLNFFNNPNLLTKELIDQLNQATEDIVNILSKLSN